MGETLYITQSSFFVCVCLCAVYDDYNDADGGRDLGHISGVVFFQPIITVTHFMLQNIEATIKSIWAKEKP